MIIIKLHDLAWKKKIKGYEIAEASGLSVATVSKLMKGENIDIKLSTVDKLCNCLNCKIEELLEFKP